MLQPDGKLIVAGSFRNTQGFNDPAFARVLAQGPAAGRLDPTFGVDGRLVDTSFEHGGLASPSSTFAAAVSIVPNTTVTRIRIYGPMDYTHFQLWPDMFLATSHAFAVTLTPDGGAVAAGQALISGAGRSRW